MMRAVVSLFTVLVACGDPPPLTLKFRITDGDVQACTNGSGAAVVSCNDIPMLCDSLVSIRIFPPNDSTAPFISQCEPLPGGDGPTNTVCQIASIELMPPTTPTKLQDLEVDMAVYRKDPKLMNANGGWDCPAHLAFSSDGFLAPPEPCDPESCDPVPAIGGRAFYHPGDEETVVTLGCSDVSTLEDMTCIGQKTLTVTANVTDFDTAVSVSPATADALLVSVGEPTFDSAVNGFVLNSTNTHPLTRDPPGPVPSWTAELGNFAPAVSACIEVLEDGAQTTAAVTCTGNLDPERLDLPGIRLAKGTLDDLLRSQTGVFPIPGLVIGEALTALGAPAPNVTITPSDLTADILYFSETGTFVGPPAMTATGTSGIWISTNAPYGTVFHARQGTTVAPDAYGGLITGKATIVISQLPP